MTELHYFSLHYPELAPQEVFQALEEVVALALQLVESRWQQVAESVQRLPVLVPASEERPVLQLGEVVELAALDPGLEVPPLRALLMRQDELAGRSEPAVRLVPKLLELEPRLGSLPEPVLVAQLVWTPEPRPGLVLKLAHLKLGPPESARV